jgi:hypothetical protein
MTQRSNQCDDLKAIANSLRELGQRWSYQVAAERLPLALANLREAVTLGAFAGVEYVELRHLIEDGPARLARRAADSEVESPTAAIVHWLLRKQKMPEWFESPSYAWDPDLYDVLADMIDAGTAGTAGTPNAVSSPPTEPAALVASPAKADRMTWLEAAKRAEFHLKRNAFPGVRTLAKIVECSYATMVKAIKRTPRLAAAKKQYQTERRGAGARTVPLTAARSETAATASHRQRSRTDAAGSEEEDAADREALLAKLINAVAPAERARLNAMNEQEKQKYIDFLRANPEYAPPVRERSRH